MKYKEKWKNPGSKHNSEYSGLYTSWYNMFERCKKSPTYSDVTVCDRWKSYDNFFEDMADTWFKGATLDKDSILPGNRVYCKEYCKWLTNSENSKERYKRCGNPSTGAMKKKIKCLNTNEIFESVHEASINKNISESSISSVARGYRKSVFGLRWEYVTKET